MKATSNLLKPLLTTGILTLSIFFAAEESAAQRAYMTQEFSVRDNAKVEVKTSGGSIEVIGTDSDQVQVEMYVKRRGDYLSPSEVDLDDWEITIEKKGNTVYAIAEKENKNWGNWRGDNFSISFKVYTPERSETDLRTSGGSVFMSDLQGDQLAKTSGGSMTAERIGGDITLRTSGGSITIEEVEGSVDANTSGGRIRAEDVTGGINARTSGGSISLYNIAGNVEAKTSGGSIDAEIVDPDDFIELRTSGGSISIKVPKDNGFDVDLGGNRVRADLANFKGELDKNDMEGTLNGGGTKLSAKTSGGSVRLSYF